MSEVPGAAGAGAPVKGAASPAGAGRALTLFVLAHHDDEVFCAGHLHRALAAGDRVRLLWATSGGLAPARLRAREGADVRRLLRLGVREAPDLGLRDQHAVFHVAEIAAAAGALLDEAAALEPPRTVTVCAPAYEGGHPDHDAVNLAVAVLRARRPGTLAREFPLYRRGGCILDVQAPYPPAGTAPAPFEELRLGDEALLLRRRLAAANASQLAPSLLPLLGLARAAGRGRAEPSRPLPDHDYDRPPHGGRLLYELYTRRRSDDLRTAARAVHLAPGTPEERQAP